jgi:hypothetical protein
MCPDGGQCTGKAQDDGRILSRRPSCPTFAVKARGLLSRNIPHVNELSDIELRLLAILRRSPGEVPSRDLAFAYESQHGKTVSYPWLYATMSRLQEAGLAVGRLESDEHGPLRLYKAVGPYPGFDTHAADDAQLQPDQRGAPAWKKRGRKGRSGRGRSRR